jgi:hypothetical protein
VIAACVTAVIAAVPASASAAIRTGSVQDPQGDVATLGGPLLDLTSIAVRYDDAAGTIRVTWTYHNDVRVGYDASTSSRPEGMTEVSDNPKIIGTPFDKAMVQWWADNVDDGSWSVSTALGLTRASGMLWGTGTLSADGRVATAEFTNPLLVGHDWQQDPGGASGPDFYSNFWFDGFSDPATTPPPPPVDPTPPPPHRGPTPRPRPPVGGEAPSGSQGMTINDGALYTQDPDVTLSVIAPGWAGSLRVANDGGFGAARTFTVRNRIRWRLAESGRERLPKTVYLRFGNQAQTFTDDIILDQTDPVVKSAALVEPVSATASDATAQTAATANEAYRIRIRAKDATSGVAKVQFAARSKRHPSAPRKFKRVSRYTGVRAPRYLRVRDRAGNYSRWRSIR